MKATRKWVRQLREQGRLHIDRDLEALILKKYGSEPYPHTYTEQDLVEQVRKLIDAYNLRHPLTSPGEELLGHPDARRGSCGKATRTTREEAKGGNP
jgi:hypothetical protein